MNAIEQLLKIMADLRAPQTGCPWDIKQNFKTLVPYTLEEAYEVADCIEKDDKPALKGELGDLLFQIVFYAQLAKEECLFDFNDVVEAISDKLVSRHPHVFAGIECRDEAQLKEAWEASKSKERDAQSSGLLSALEGVAAALPALKRAQKLQKRAARTGFDWPTIEPVYGKVFEEINEIKEAVEEKDQAHIEEEMGDLLFACVNLSRHLQVDAEEALRKGNQKFIQRFNSIEAAVQNDNKSIADYSLQELEWLWDKAKSKE